MVRGLESVQALDKSDPKWKGYHHRIGYLSWLVSKAHWLTYGVVHRAGPTTSIRTVAQEFT